MFFKRNWKHHFNLSLLVESFFKKQFFSLAICLAFGQTCHPITRRLDITGCVGVEFEPNESSLECPMEGYEIYRNEELLGFFWGEFIQGEGRVVMSS